MAVAFTNAHAAGLFEFDRGGQRLIFSVPDDQPMRAATADPTRVADEACRWILYRFDAREPEVEAVEFRPWPVRHWVVRVSTTVAARRDILYAVVLVDGTPVVPRVLNAE